MPSGSVGVMVKGPKITIEYACVTDEPAELAALIVKVTVPALFGLPLMVTMPAVELTAKLAALKPVLPALKVRILKVLSAVLLPLTLIVWL